VDGDMLASSLTSYLKQAFSLPFVSFELNILVRDDLVLIFDGGGGIAFG
jgi:hypothetical protein